LIVRTNPITGDYVLRKLNPSEPKVSANAVPSARKARTTTSEKAPGARAAKHSKAVVEEPLTAPSGAAPAVAAEPASAPVAAQPEVPVAVVPAPVIEMPVVEVLAPNVKTVSSEEIAKLAYCYWADRGYQGGDPQEDWARAEKALLSLI
jgi:hypothetical protein